MAHLLVYHSDWRARVRGEHTQEEMRQSTGQVDGGGDEVLGRCEDGLDGVQEGFDDGAEDVED